MKRKVMVSGNSGNMGRRVIERMAADCGFIYSGGINSSTSLNEYDELIEASDVVIDFSHDAVLHSIIPACRKFHKPIVSGTTALSSVTLKSFNDAASDIAVFHASNFCISIHLMANYVSNAVSALKDFDVDITEIHHKRKKDSPSGTALYLRDRMLEKTPGRSINITSKRYGECVGEHTVSFYGDGEVLSIKHEASNRDIFACGALNVARWIINKSHGVYSMQDYICDQLKI